ncbi:MAG: ATP-binding protein [bacterium]
MRVLNPFIIVGYEGPQYFCDRKNETERLINAIENGRNVTLISLRRMGKTGLIRHVFHKLKRKKNSVCIYVDMMPTNDLDSFVKKFGFSLFSGSALLTSKALKTISGFFSNLKLTISYDSISGSPSISAIPTGEDDLFNTVDEIFKYISNQNENFVIAFDEFQQAMNYKEQNLIAHLRSNIQNTGNANFIFSGSQKHTLLSMFTSHNQPFYQSTEIMDLQSIQKNEYADFIQKNFYNGNILINDETIDYLLDKTNTHTYFVQYICNKLYSLQLKNIDKQNIDEIFSRILRENETIYYNYRKLLSNNQWNLLTAIAKEKGIDKPTSNYFISKYNLGQASSVALSLKNLEEKEIIYADNQGCYNVADIFLSAWLIKNA